jgi:hypothetical protein
MTILKTVTGSQKHGKGRVQMSVRFFVKKQKIVLSLPGFLLVVKAIGRMEKIVVV